MDVFKVEKNFTKVYKEHSSSHAAIREVMCLKAMFPDALSPIEKGDLFVGRFIATPGASKVRNGWNAKEHNMPAIGFLPLTPGDGKSGAGYYCHPDKLKKKLVDSNACEKAEKEIEDLIDFWSKETIEFKVRNAYSSAVAQALPFDDLVSEQTSWPAYPLIRITGPMYDNEKLVTLGLPGLEKVILKKLSQSAIVNDSYFLFKAMLKAIDLIRDVCQNYIEELKQLLAGQLIESERRNYELMKTSLTNICTSAPNSFHEAIQLVFIYGVVSGAYSWGRMDDYLADFYVGDVQAGIISEDEALAYMCSFWQLINDNGAPYDNRVIIGGRGRKNEENANKFAHLAIKATRLIKETLPQLSLRFYEGQDVSLYKHALESIAEGRTFPMLYNDDVNIDAVQKAMNISRKDAEQYVPYGCGEYAIYKKSVHTPSGVINNLKVLECVLHNGCDLVSGNKIPIEIPNIHSYASFDELFDAYKKVVEYFVAHLAIQQKAEYDTVAKNGPHVLWSVLYDDCIERGKSVFEGGLSHLGGTLESYGQVNAADSLMAIKKLVFEEKKYTLRELVEGLDCNFENNSILHKELLAVQKYGNDDAEADNMFLEVHNHLCNFTKKQAKLNGLDSYLIVVINNLMNTILGENTLASADGRKAFEYMANGNNPMPGRDKAGITAFLNSISKPAIDIHAGAVQNMKFSKELFVQQEVKIKALLAAYFKKGAQAMISVVSKNDLEQAMKEPQKWTDLIIRVGGFSSRFVELPKHVQKEVLDRTLND